MVIFKKFCQVNMFSLCRRRVYVFPYRGGRCVFHVVQVFDARDTSYVKKKQLIVSAIFYRRSLCGWIFGINLTDSFSYFSTSQLHVTTFSMKCVSFSISFIVSFWMSLLFCVINCFLTCPMSFFGKRLFKLSQKKIYTTVKYRTLGHTFLINT